MNYTESDKAQIEKIVTPSPKYKLGTVVKYFDEKRRGILHYGEIVEIVLRRDGVIYRTQDHSVVRESDVKAELYEMPF